jgi:hypothetical protein
MQMGPGIFFHRLGLIGCSRGGLRVVPVLRGRFSVLRQLGRTSLLIYWVHIEFCYGSLVYALRGRFSIPEAAALVGFSPWPCSACRWPRRATANRWSIGCARAFVPHAWRDTKAIHRETTWRVMQLE